MLRQKASSSQALAIPCFDYKCKNQYTATVLCSGTSTLEKSTLNSGFMSLQNLLPPFNATRGKLEKEPYLILQLGATES